MRSSVSSAIVAVVTLLIGNVLLTIDAMAEERVAWTTSRVTGSPEPPLPYVVERVHPEVAFQNPVDFAVEPTTGHWFVLQLNGKLFSFDPQTGQEPILLADMKQQVDAHNNSYGITFHPNYAENRQLFWSYVLKPDQQDGTKVVRLTVSESDPPTIDLSEQELLITWPSGGHNGACLKFGPDDMLYITTGDGTGPFPPDSADVGQDLSDLRSTILRIDVDQPGGDDPYSIPEDNPFLSIPEARPEIWAFGFRNPWKISFDPQTGELWCGDVGWELWELVFNVVRGGNYGWSLMEGRQPVRIDLPRGPGEIIPPVVDHLHTEARSVTGGYVYHGKEIPELKGAYIYGDYVTGKIWGLRSEGNKPTWHQELSDSSLAIITFGVDADGELIILDYAGGLYRLKPRERTDSSEEFPRLLSETGLFGSVASQQVAPGVLPYELNARMFADGADAKYYLGIPDLGSITIGRNREHWKYPRDTVFAKTLSLEDRNIETQLLHFDGDEWRAYAYRWNDDQTDAELVEKEGADLELKLKDGRARHWRIHSRSECLTCHMPRAGFTLGPSIANLNQSPVDMNELSGQLARWVDWKVFANEIPRPDLKFRMVNPYDEEADLDARAQSYLAINCAHCHRRGGGGTARIEFPFEHQREQWNAIDEPPTQGTFGITDAKIIAPGSPYHSVLYYRMATIGRGHMPHLGPRTIDDNGLQLVRDWISSLAPSQDAVPLSVTSKDDLSEKEKELLFLRTDLTMEFVDLLDEHGVTDEIIELAVMLAEECPPHHRGLYERLIPPDRRQPTLGTSVDAAAILSIPGDPEKGADLFLIAEGVSCRNCHRIGEVGKPVGPDLSKIAKERTREQLLESILAPSKVVDPKFAMTIVETKAGRILTGIIVKRTEDGLTLRDATGVDKELKNEEIEVAIPQTKSLMPDLLVKDMTAADLANLLAYLSSLK